MRSNAQRLGLLFAAGFLISIAVVACGSPQAPVPSSYIPSSGNGGFHTPNPNQNTATPAFPGFTVGAWPSNYSPNNTDTITIYVICRIQDPSMQTPAKPAQGVSLLVTFTPMGPGVPNNFPSVTGQTGPDGIAAFTIQVNDPASGVPIEVQVAATYAGAGYVAQTFFTPNPGASACPSASPGPGTPPTGGGPGGCAGGTPSPGKGP